MLYNVATLRLSLLSPGQLAKIPGPSLAVRRSLVCPSCRCVSASGGKRADLGVVCFTLTPPGFGSMEGRDRRAGGAGVAEGVAQSLHAHMHQALDEWRSNISRARRWTVAVKSDLSQRLSRALINMPRHLASPGNARGQYHIAPMFASISSAVTRRAHRPQPIGDVALGRDDIRSRLSAVPVFTVVNSKEEIVLVTGEGATDSPKQLGMFFFTRDDALAMVNRIKDYDESMGKDSRVVSVTLDTVYDLFIKPPQQLSKPSTMLRFIPHPPQVERALGVLSKEGVSKPSFGGVPLFQAENLVVTGKNGGKFVPLFFSKDDLDLAVASAFEQRMQAQIKELEVKARKYQAEADKARSQWAEADRKERKGLKEKADEEQRKAEEALEKAERVRRSSMPRVEVGSLEEVLVKMQEDGKGEFSSVMFVPIGTVQADAVADDVRSDGASGGKKAVNKSRKAAKA